MAAVTAVGIDAGGARKGFHAVALTDGAYTGQLATSDVEVIRDWCLDAMKAQVIVAGLSPFAPEAAALKAGRLMLREIDDCIKQQESFAFETTLSGLGYLSRIRHWRLIGYEVSLYFLALPSAEKAIMRVAARVKQGGHNIPESAIRRRFIAGLRNFETFYKSKVDHWVKYDNFGDRPVLTEWGELSGGA
jgi:predicted ABC-type ATPase